MPVAPSSVFDSLNAPMDLSASQIEFFRSNGFIKLNQVFEPATVEYLNTIVSNEVRRLNTQHLPIEERDTYGKAFLQIMNIWTRSEAVKELVFSKRLAKLAADLLEVKGVRLYHDQALFKEPCGGYTPWHADQYYWPLASDRTVTAWIPLQATPLQMGPLAFSAGSQNLTTGRNLKISDESEQVLEHTLKNHGFTQVEEAFDAGEVSFHLGWLYHRAGANKTNQMRGVMTMIYMDKNMKLKSPENENQIADWETWCPGTRVGEVINTSLNPVLWG